MGAFNFYLDIKIAQNAVNDVAEAYQRNSLYVRAFHFGVVSNSEEEKYNAGISALLDNFLPATMLIYEFLAAVRQINGIFSFRTNNCERQFDFESQQEFVIFMCTVWFEKIKYSYGQFGTIVLDHKNYIKTRNRLFKKHYKLLP